MSKAFFRFLRGELNGFYLSSLNAVCNNFTGSIRRFLTDFKAMQFKSEDEVGQGEVTVTTDVLEGISVFTGVFSPLVWQDALTGSVRFTKSHIVNVKERSERGLYRIEDETFNFVHTEQDDYPADINTLSSLEERSTLVEKDRQPLGWFPEGENVIKEDGSLDLTKLMTAPRPNHADSPYFGDRFLYFAEESPVKAVTSNRVLIYLIKAMQWVRYNGSSVKSLAEFISIICPNFLFIIDIDWESNYAFAVVTYGIDENCEAEDKLMREQLFTLLAGKKLPQLSFNRVAINVTRNSEGKVISVETLD